MKTKLTLWLCALLAGAWPGPAWAQAPFPVQSDGPGCGATFTLELPLNYTKPNIIPAFQKPDFAT